MTIDVALKRLVWERANSCCEYCSMPQKYNELTHEVDHIIAEQHGGPTNESNTCLACFSCNKHKGPNIGSVDPMTNQRVDLFDPHQGDWRSHFRWDGPILEGLTSVGRATVRLLVINRPDRVALRQSLIEEGVFPQPTIYE